jgi:hypothetical protein
MFMSIQQSWRRASVAGRSVDKGSGVRVTMDLVELKTIGD